MEITRIVTGLVVTAVVAGAVGIGAVVMTPQTDPDVSPEAIWQDVRPADSTEIWQDV